MKTWKTTSLVYLLLLGGACAAWHAGSVLLSGDSAGLCGTSEDEAEAQRLDCLQVDLTRRLMLKEEITQRFVAGELTLLEAAAEFYKINHTPSETPDRYTIHLPGATEEERTCSQVISWASAVLRDRHDPEVEAIIADLKYELAWQVCEHGRPILPGIPEPR
jgi:hypothetical protein